MALGYVLFEADRFTTLLDRHGLRAGDTLLARVAEFLAGNVRQSDFVAHLDGHEFVLLLPETGSGDTLQLAEKLRLQVGKAGISWRDEPLGVTLSAGVTQFRSDDTLEMLHARAGTALHCALLRAAATAAWRSKRRRRPALARAGIADSGHEHVARGTRREGAQPRDQFAAHREAIRSER